IVAETGDEIWLIDKHAAHERILYEELKAHGGASAQLLIEPVTVTLSREEYGAVMENLESLRSAGFGIEDFGGTSVLLREAPMLLRAGDAAASLQELAGSLALSRKDALPERIERLYHSVACRAAVKGGDRNSLPELDAIAARVIEMDDIRYCPHGRPVAFILMRGELEKQFGRS
ncbi:MAG: DNA mismatch repair protein MutL, partial [Clostridia bacterium]|nr:DNA mismatch repair protein MutL [Clostridia bacterium]